jgi:hypothetical protein
MRLSAHLTVVTAALAALAAAAPAADSINAAPYQHSAVAGEQYDINDLRLTAGFLPKNNDVDGNGFNWAVDNRLALTGMRAPNPLQDYGGLIYGGEFAIDHARRTTSTDRITLYRFMVDAMVGWAYRFDQLPGMHLEGTPFLGLGFERYHSDLGGSPTALGYEYGLRVADYYTFTNKWQVGVDLRWYNNNSEPDFGTAAGGSRKFETSGIAVLFSGGKRF